MRWPFSHTTCQISVALRYIGAFGAWMSLGLVAVSRLYFYPFNQRLNQEFYNFQKSQFDQTYLVEAHIWWSQSLLADPLRLVVCSHHGPPFSHPIVWGIWLQPSNRQMRLHQAGGSTIKSTHRVLFGGIFYTSNSHVCQLLQYLDHVKTVHDISEEKFEVNCVHFWCDLIKF